MCRDLSFAEVSWVERVAVPADHVLVLQMSKVRDRHGKLHEAVRPPRLQAWRCVSRDKQGRPKTTTNSFRLYGRSTDFAAGQPVAQGRVRRSRFDRRIERKAARCRCGVAAARLAGAAIRLRCLPRCSALLPRPASNPN